MSRQLIFNADDYGLSPGVSKGILRAANGVVRSTTVMANLVSNAELAWLKNSSLRAGAHLNLTIGPPLTTSFPRQLLNESGWFDKTVGLRASTWASDKMQAVVAKEWSAQIALLHASGLHLTHLDSHHHTHLLAPLFPIALRLAEQHGIGIRTRSAQTAGANRCGVATPAGFEEGFFGEHKISQDVILQLLADTDATCLEVMCHPGLVDTELLLKSGYRFERVCELKTLGSPRLRRQIEKQGWELCGYDQI